MCETFGRIQEYVPQYMILSRLEQFRNSIRSLHVHVTASS